MEFTACGNVDTLPPALPHWSSDRLLTDNSFGISRDLNLRFTFSPEKETDDTTTITQSRAIISREWKPVLLRRNSFHAFTALFVALAIGLETSFVISGKRQGPATTTFSDTHFAWTYGPALVVTVVSAVWVCIDFSAKAAAPWLRLGVNGKDPRNMLLTDYLSAFSLFVPFRAVWNGDFLVISTSTISFLLLIMMVFAPSLIGLATMEMSAPLAILSEFVDNPSELSGAGIWPLYQAMGVKKYHVEYPFGIQKNMVFQSFTPLPSAVTSLYITVEALSFDLQCELATIKEFNAAPSAPFMGPPTITLDIGQTSSGCSRAMGLNPLFFDLGDGYFAYNSTSSRPPQSIGTDEVEAWVARLFPGVCNTNTLQHGPDDRRILWAVFRALLSLTSGTILGIERIPNIQALVCKPVYSMMSVDIWKQKNDSYHITPAQKTGTTKFAKLHGWDIAQAILNSYKQEQGATLSDVIGTLSFDHMGFPSDFGEIDPYAYQGSSFDYISKAILALDAGSYPSPGYVFDYDLLRQSIEGYFSDSWALAHSPNLGVKYKSACYRIFHFQGA